MLLLIALRSPECLNAWTNLNNKTANRQPQITNTMDTNNKTTTKPQRHETYGVHSAKDLETAKLLVAGASIGILGIIIGTVIDFLCS